MNTLRGLLTLFAMFTLYSCRLFTPVGDGAFEIEGMFFVNNEVAVSCQMDLYREKGDAFLSRQVMPGSFRNFFVVAPWRESYYVLVSCEGSPEIFHSEVFVIKDLSTLRNPIDLGTIHLAADE